MNTRNYLSVRSPIFYYFTADLIRRTVISSLLFHFFGQHRKDSDIGVFLYVGSLPLFIREGVPQAQECCELLFPPVSSFVRVFAVANIYVLLEWTTSLDSSSGTLICDSLCPHHVGRNYVPLLCGVDTVLRYYVIRDVIVV